MNVFFESLKEGKTVDESLKIFKNKILKTKLDLSSEGKSYEEYKKEFDELVKLQLLCNLLKKMTSN